LEMLKESRNTMG